MAKVTLKLWLILGVIILLAFGLRVFRVTEVPPSLNWDEVAIGYNAYSILKTGQDEWGQSWPLHFKSYGEYKLPAQIYASIPGIAVFGLNDFGVRITPVVYGTLTVLVAFGLGLVLFESAIVGLIAAFLLAISPWHLQLTRGSFEASFATFWISLGILLLVMGLKNGRWWILSAISFAISVFTYNSARVFAPLFGVVVGLVYFKQFFKQFQWAILAGVIFVVLLSPLIPFAVNGEASARYKLVSVTDDPGLLPRINENRGNSKLAQPLPRLVHNKVTYIGLAIAEHYLAHFSPQFLFISGAPHKQHHVQNMGQLYLFEAPFLLLGLLMLFKSGHKYRWLLVGWIMLAYVPVSVTNDSIPHALRTVIVLPAYQLISAFGAVKAWQWWRRKKWNLVLPVGLLVVTMIGCLSWYFYQYYLVYPVQYSRDWQYGYAKAVNYVTQHEQEYDQVIFSRTYGEPHMFTLFYSQYDPARFQNDPELVRFETYNWVRVLHFGKFYFPDLGDIGTRYGDIIQQNPGNKLLFIGRPGEFPAEARKIDQINFLNGVPAFEIVEYK